MSAGSWVTHADRAGRQLKAARELAAILGDCGDLPLITWMAAPAGLVLSGPAPAGRVRAVFGAWREALALDCREWPGGGGTVRLHAAGRRGEVKVRVSATVSGEEQ